MYNDFHKGLVAFGKTLDTEIQTLTKEWSDIYESRLKNRGKADAVKFMKELCNAAERYALRQPIEPIPWTKSDNDNFPRLLNKFKTYLISKDDKQVIMALSVMRSCESLRLPISKDLESVTDPPKGVDSTVLEEIIDFIPSFVKSIKPLTLGEMEYHPTVKNGPNGHALWSSDQDIRSVVTTPKLYEAIRTVERKLSDTYPMSEINLDNVKGNFIHSKITQFPEKSGKTRTIAIIDYYSQRCLKPLHEGLMTLLKSMVSDGTNSHENVGMYARQKTKSKDFIYCSDLSAATDRFPKEIQRVLLDELLKDRELSTALWTLLAERQFVVSWSGEIVTYNCGQPMGAYSSWPLFALAHHLTVEFCAFKAQISIAKAKHLYRVIGDDVIIADESIARIYQNVMPSLGLTINQGKTVLSLPSQPHSCAEVAKRFYLDGRCLTPLTPGFVRDLKKPYMFNTCMQVLNERYEFFSSEVPSMLIRNLYPKDKDFKQVWMQCSDPIDGYIKPGFPGYDENSPWVGIDKEMAINLYRDFQVEAYMNAAITYSNDIGRNYMKSGDPWTNLNGVQPIALTKVVTTLKLKLDRAVNRFQFVMGPDCDAILEELAYIPDPIQPYRSRKELKSQRQSRLKVEIYNQIKMWE